jgi:hypothetical protein
LEDHEVLGKADGIEVEPLTEGFSLTLCLCEDILDLGNGLRNTHAVDEGVLGDKSDGFLICLDVHLGAIDDRLLGLRDKFVPWRFDLHQAIKIGLEELKLPV